MGEQRVASASRPPKGKTRSAQGGSAIRLGTLELKPVTLIRGKEGALAERIVSQLRFMAEQNDPNLEVSSLSATGYTPGQLALWTSPSLFGENRFISIEGIEAAGSALVDDLVDYVKDPQPDVILVLRHRGGNQNRKIVDRVKAAGFPLLLADELKNDGDKVALVTDEADRLNGRLIGQAAQRMVDAAGNDLYELLGVVRQLLTDNDGEVTETVVREFFSGRIETTGFEVADAVAAGDGPRALLLARRAFASGVDPVPIVAVLAMKLREMAKVGAPGATNQSLGLPSWRVEQIRQVARRWNPESLGTAICQVARTDIAVKGGSRDPHGAVEKCIIAISRIRAQNGG